MNIEVNTNSMEDAIRNIDGVLNSEMSNSIDKINVTFGDKGTLANMINDTVCANTLQSNGYVCIKDNSNSNSDSCYNAYIYTDEAGSNDAKAYYESEATQRYRLMKCFGDVVADNKIACLNSINDLDSNTKHWITDAYAETKAAELYSIGFGNYKISKEQSKVIDEAMFEFIVGNYNRWEDPNSFMLNIFKIMARLRMFNDSLRERQDSVYRERSRDDTERYGRVLERKVLLVDLEEQVDNVISSIEKGTIDRYDFRVMNRLVSRMLAMLNSEKTVGEVRISYLATVMDTDKLIKELAKED